jgi:glycosyltransferase involved in cell wall biosynthesis
MIEAMACGTPVLAFDHGSVREVIDDGVTGRVVTNFEEAVRELPQVMRLDRRQVRRRFEKRFSARRMAKDYVRIYQKQISRPLSERHRRVGAGEQARLNGDGLLADTGLHVD